jgi:hypothetical protein
MACRRSKIPDGLLPVTGRWRRYFRYLLMAVLACLVGYACQRSAQMAWWADVDLFEERFGSSSLRYRSFAGLAEAAARLPEFADYPARRRFRGKPSPVRLNSTEARLYRMRLREGAKEGPNFSGHYTIVTWGCGTGCIAFAIVDAATGRVSCPHFSVSWGQFGVGEERLREREPLEFRRDSRLLVVTGSRNERGKGVYYYEWTGRRLKLLMAAFETK